MARALLLPPETSLPGDPGLQRPYVQRGDQVVQRLLLSATQAHVEFGADLLRSFRLSRLAGDQAILHAHPVSISISENGYLSPSVFVQGRLSSGANWPASMTWTV